MRREFIVRGAYIQLDQLLKATALVGSGGEAHAVVAAGLVRVDGEVERRKRAKLRPGQRVAFQGEMWVLRGAVDESACE
ncbi:MAG: RNA-binding S4 domain-containing protein [Azovibrio sp.]|nr:RNA-binding S4 domain-containing protein [Azovibrio sp.]